MKKRENASEIQRHAAQRLKAARLALGFASQEDFAKHLGATRTQYGHWEQGTRMPGVHAMLRLLHHFGIPLEWVYAGQLRHVPHSLAAALIKHAEELGAPIERESRHGPSARDQSTIHGSMQ